MNLPVLRRYYHQVEEAHRAELAVLQRELHDAREARLELDRTLEDYVRRFLDDVRDGLAAGEAAARHAGLDHLAVEMHRADERLGALGDRVEQKREEVLTARRETKKLDLLWERQRRRARQREERRDQQAIDEVAARRYLVEQRRRG